MTEPGSLEQADLPAENHPRISAWKISVTTMLVGIVLFILFIAVRAIAPAGWKFSVEALTEVAEVQLRPDSDTRWQIDGAIVCSRTALPLPDEFRVTATPNPCGSRAWRAWQVIAPEQVLRLNGGAAILVQSLADGGLAMSLRTESEAGLGSLSVIGLVDEMPLGQALNLVWQSGTVATRLFPFTGTTTLGRAVNWADSRLLQSGEIVVYTADESADKRTEVDSANLMLGDQVRLDVPKSGFAWPKGFLRVSHEAAALQVVAFGQADSMHIERYGDSGYDFRPGLISSLASDPAIAFWGSLLAAYMTLILSLQPFVNKEAGDVPPAGTWQKFMRWFRKEATQ